MLIRNTGYEVNLKNLAKNLRMLNRIHQKYEYRFAVVKADCYGIGSCTKVIKTIVENGCNYLAVATLEEALEIRKRFDTPILCLGVVQGQYIEACIQNDITVTIPSVAYLEEILENEDCEDLKVHLKIDTGMNRLGVSSNNEALRAVGLIKLNHIKLEGIYTHIYDAKNPDNYLKQLEKFMDITDGIDLDKVKIVHIAASEAVMNYTKPVFVNGCRFGIIMYGFTEEKALRLRNVLKLYSEVVQINELNPGETLRIWRSICSKRENENCSSGSWICKWRHKKKQR